MTETMNTTATASLLGLSPSTLSIWRYQGRGPKYLKFGRRVLYRRSDVELYIEAHQHQSTAEYEGRP